MKKKSRLMRLNLAIACLVRFDPQKSSKINGRAFLFTFANFIVSLWGLLYHCMHLLIYNRIQLTKDMITNYK